VTGILALVGSAILAAAAVFTFFGGYWYQLWKEDK